MKQYLKKFNSTVEADNYHIKDIPFITAVATDPVQNLVCNQLGKKLVSIGGVIEIQSAYPQSDEIWYTSSDGKIVAPYKTSSLPEIDTNTYSDGKGIIKFKTDVTSIGDYTFYDCHNLTSITIPNSVTSIGYGAFYECSSLTSVTIPNSVTSIGIGVFDFCSSLTYINVESENLNYSSEDGVLFNKYQTTIIRYPEGKYGEYNIQNSVENIEDLAFFNCTGLTSVIISYNVTIIGYGVFGDCTGLTSIEIPDSVESIGEKAFAGCTSLNSITIPKSVTSIGYRAFINCTGLTYIEIPDSVEYIGEYAFEDCQNLEYISYTGTVSDWNKIELDVDWASHINTTVVHCSDGDVNI